MMDEFLCDINMSIFRQWVLLQDKEGFNVTIDEDHDFILYVDTKYGHGEVSFWPNHIIDLSVYNTFNDRPEFYLHFQMRNFKHALELYNEMLTCLKGLMVEQKVKVLLCCSGGMTTTYFANKIQQACDLLKYNYTISAIGYNEVYNIGNEYDMICLAPQVAYNLSTMQGVFNHTSVVAIPNQTFAKYDIASMLHLIEDTRNNKKLDFLQGRTVTQYNIPSHPGENILAISIYRNHNKINIAYRIYDENNDILNTNEIIKDYITLHDLYDVIDTILTRYPIKNIAVALPGIINGKVVTSTSIHGLDYIDFNKLENKYKKTFTLINEVNSGAVGYFASQQQYHNLSLYFQPTETFGGIGSIVNGQLITGKHNVAGEVQFLPLKLSNEINVLNKTPERILELLAKIIVSNIAITGPEAVIISCTLLTDLELLKEEIKKLLPEEYIPDLIKLNDIQEYILLGCLVLSINQ